MVPTINIQEMFWLFLKLSVVQKFAYILIFFFQKYSKNPSDLDVDFGMLLCDSQAWRSISAPI